MKIPNDLENTLIVLFFATLIASMALYLNFYPPQREAFFSTAVLSSKDTVYFPDYFPTGNTTARPGDNITWSLQTTSHMPDAQYIEWRIKLLNASYPNVNSALCQPSLRREFFTSRQLLTPGQTRNLPINWTITSATRNGNSITLNTMTFNGTINNHNLQATNATGYRLLFELWRLDITTSTWTFTFPFTYQGTQSLRCWWLQVYFTVGGT